MNIDLIERKDFEKIKGTESEDRIIDEFKIISINSNYDVNDLVPPFSTKNISHPNILILYFDDVDIESRGVKDLFNKEIAKKIIEFIDTFDKFDYLMIQDKDDKFSRAGALGEILNSFYNVVVENNEKYNNEFIKEYNKVINPNLFIESVMAVKLLNKFNKEIEKEEGE